LNYLEANQQQEILKGSSTIIFLIESKIQRKENNQFFFGCDLYKNYYENNYYIIECKLYNNILVKK